METTINDLQRNPELRKLLTRYCQIQYEESARLDDLHLLQEYHLLLKGGNLNELFECEKLSNQ